MTIQTKLTQLVAIGPVTEGDQNLVATDVTVVIKTLMEWGIRGPVGPQGPAGGVPYIHDQGPALATWIINHNLGRRVNTEIFTVGGVKVLADVVNVTLNQVQINFDSANSGYAIIN